MSSQNARLPDYYVDPIETLEDLPVSLAWYFAERRIVEMMDGQSDT